MQEFDKTLGFLFDVTKLRKMEETNLQRQCERVSDALGTSESQDIIAPDLFAELMILRDIIRKETTTVPKTLRYLKELFLTEIALRILLTFPVMWHQASEAFQS
ncbi:hypothetical protein CHARACLAT_025240 [Characodon lateralis]|uniref:Uncharacterized protein n=1 Tax=Characodon lateralis TaxID=208331 RepID=A0ABU7DNF4_9TELE|nr:hypothetical protein [Characodon lateralis]